MASADTVTIGVLQAAFTSSVDANVRRITELAREAAGKGANFILPPELFEGTYFCREECDAWFAAARPAAGHPTITHFQSITAELGVAIPVSFFEKAGPAYFNSVAMINTDGAVVGIYRKSHLPSGPGYQEKYYFRPGDTGFKVWRTRYASVGVGICWDQWFPECARAMVLLGADLLMYPSAIGSEPDEPTLDTKDQWQRAMIGHAVSNVIPVAAANRVGTEGTQIFYGHSFITDHRGDKVAELGRTDEGVIVASFHPNTIARERASFGFFRDRRPELYGILTTADGTR
jgi:N-carbamoylputrescine amidase